MPDGGRDLHSWYYRIELEPGRFTSERPHPNLALTRQLVRSVALAGCDVIDLGTQEAVMPILAARAGARAVGYDYEDRTARVEAAREAYGVSFDYVGGLELPDLPATLDRRGTRYHDLVIFAGVLYHLINPFGYLALARGLCRLDGLFLLETIMLDEPGERLEVNTAGKLYGGFSNYFVPTVGAVDYLLRMLGLRPLRAVQLPRRRDSSCRRVAVLCRSEGRPCPRDPDDVFAARDCHRRSFRKEAQFDFSLMELAGPSHVTLGRAEPDVLPLDDRPLYDQLHGHPAHRPAPEKTVLTLDGTV